MQAPILLAILEYGFVLAMKMGWKSTSEVYAMGNKFSLSDLFNVLDIFTFVFSSLILSGFNIFYWSYYYT